MWRVAYKVSTFAEWIHSQEFSTITAAKTFKRIQRAKFYATVLQYRNAKNEWIGV